MFLIKNDVNILNECWFLKNDINHLCLEFISILFEQNEDYLDHSKIEEKLILEKILNKL